METIINFLVISLTGIAILFGVVYMVLKFLMDS